MSQDMCLVRLRMEKRRRVGAALRIQAYYRARCERAKARMRLLAKFSKEHDVLVRKRWKLERKRQKYAVMHLQRYIRGHFGRMRAHARWWHTNAPRAVLRHTNACAHARARAHPCART